MEVGCGQLLQKKAATIALTIFCHVKRLEGDRYLLFMFYFEGNHVSEAELLYEEIRSS